MTEKRVLCVHGVGAHPPGGAWEQQWAQAIREQIARQDPSMRVEVAFAHHDDIFDGHDLTFWGTLEALAKLVSSGITAPFRRSRGLGGSLRWTAGMVVQWVENEAVRAATRARLAERIEEVRPHVICAHSLGSLIAYDTFTTAATADTVKNRIFVTLGSQIGNPFVSGNFLAGRILPLEAARHWYHLYNEHDDVFAAPIHLAADNFDQVETEFDDPGIADHAATSYLTHPHTAASVWSRVVAETHVPRLFRVTRRRKSDIAFDPPQRRALLIGINQYPDPAMRLEGCVNDVFLMSELLQETGFAAEDIRMVLDERATAAAIRDRLEWFLGGLRAGDQRVLYYSGHGAQLPTYGLGDTVDRMDETLVPWDFDWSPETSVTDDYFYRLYSQLPYEASLVAIFDCCHSAGLTRDGTCRVRGINPPDDIRHRALAWSKGSWAAREIDPSRSHRAGRYAGAATPPAVSRLGFASGLRTLAGKAKDRRRAALGHRGPYMPLLFYACQEDQFAYEHRVGATAYGAFTYSMASTWRQARAGRRRTPTFAQLGKLTAKAVNALHPNQLPTIIGPEDWLKQEVPV